VPVWLVYTKQLKKIHKCRDIMKKTQGWLMFRHEAACWARIERLPSELAYHS
jgi:hypothetical protein